MPMRRFAVALFCLVASCGSDPKGRLSEEELLAATPGGTLGWSVDQPEMQVHGAIPAFLFGTDEQIANGVNKHVPNSPGTLHRWGQWYYFHMTGSDIGTPETRTKLVQRGRFEDGRRVGKWTMWYPDGKKRGEGPFVDNKMHGSWRVWTPTGEVDAVHSGNYVDGVKAK